VSGLQAGAALQFEVQLSDLEKLDLMRHRGGPGEDTGDSVRAFSEIFRSPFKPEVLRVHEMRTSWRRRLFLPRSCTSLM
jgi:hypothetical protein